jgi:hypothetical protein
MNVSSNKYALIAVSIYLSFLKLNCSLTNWKAE